MGSALDVHPEGDAYYLTPTDMPVKMDDRGRFRGFDRPGARRPVITDTRGLTSVSRFVFLAHLAARGESSLYTVGEVAIAVGGFASDPGLAFEHDPERDEKRGKVRLPTQWELDAKGSGDAREIKRKHFADVAIYGPPVRD
ncbi:MAG TPA: hypothetical protein VGK75_10375 [Casimicrobiaceae bacterium]|jgi:hypothetical protein